MDSGTAYQVPKEMRFMCSKLLENSQPSVNVLRLNTLNQDTVRSGGLLIVRLPLGMVDLSSFTWNFSPVVKQGTQTGSGGAPGVDGILPTSEQLIQRLEISLNGMSICSAPNYSTLARAMTDIKCDLSDKVGRSVSQNDRDYAPIISTGDGAVYSIGNYDPPTISGGVMTVRCYSPVVVKPEAFVVRAPPTSFFGWASSTPLVTVTAQPIAILPTNTTPTALSQAVGYGSVINLIYSIGNGGWVQVGSTPPKFPFSIIMGTSQASPCYAPNVGQQSVSDWLVFFGKSSPSLVNTSAIAEIEVRITLQNDTILGLYPVLQDSTSYTSVAPNDYNSFPSYTLENNYFTIRSLSFDTGAFDDLLSMVLQDSPVELAFENFVSIQQVQSGGASSTRFSVNSTCLDKVIGVNRYPNASLPQLRSFLIPSGFGNTSRDTMGMTYRPAPWCSYVGGGASLLNCGVPFNSSAQLENEYQYLINNQLVPAVRITPGINYEITRDVFGYRNKEQNAGTLAVYKNSQYVMPINIAVPVCESDDDEGEMYGTDTRGQASQFYLSQTIGDAGAETSIFSLFKSKLVISGGQQVSLVL